MNQGSGVRSQRQQATVQTREKIEALNRTGPTTNRLQREGIKIH